MENNMERYTDAEVGLLIREKRKAHGLTQKELGEKLGVCNSAVYKWEKGIVRNIKRPTLQKLANILDCNPLTLVGFKHAEDQPKELIITEGEYTPEEFEQIEQFVSFIKSKRAN